MKKAINESYDAIVIGTGPGGGMVAKELAQKGLKILILEKGGNPKLRGAFWQYILYQCIPFKSLLITNELLGMVRGLITGGSSVFYYGTCFDTPVEMLRSYGVDIRSEMNEVKKELPVGPMKDEMIGDKAKMLMKSARELGYDWKKLNKFVYQNRFDPKQHRAHYYYGDPRGVKWNSSMLVQQALKKGAQLVNHANVKRVIIEDGVAVGVEYKKRGLTRRVYGKRIIVAAGGIGSPVILRKSGISRAGYDYFFDPLISIVGYVKGVKNDHEIPMSAGFHMKDEGYVMTDMDWPKMLNWGFSIAALRFHRMFSNRSAVRIMVKAKDTLGGRLTNSGGVRKKLIREDKEKLQKGYRRAREILENMGAKGIHKTWPLAAHPGGTVKIGDIVNSNLKTRFDNLYVCDCSVIPEAWGLPPVLTILSLAKRLSKHLLKSKAAGRSASQKSKAAAKKRPAAGKESAVKKKAISKKKTASKKVPSVKKKAVSKKKKR